MSARAVRSRRRGVDPGVTVEELVNIAMSYVTDPVLDPEDRELVRLGARLMLLVLAGDPEVRASWAAAIDDAMGAVREADGDAEAVAAAVQRTLG